MIEWLNDSVPTWQMLLWIIGATIGSRMWDDIKKRKKDD